MPLSKVSERLRCGNSIQSEDAIEDLYSQLSIVRKRTVQQTEEQYASAENIDFDIYRNIYSKLLV